MESESKISIEDLKDMQFELRQLLFCRPAKVTEIESKAIKLCDAIIKYSEQNQ